MINAALSLAARGWPVFPLNGKRPITRNGLHDASTDPTLINAWWTKHPQAWVGLRCGEPSGIVVVDLDPGSRDSVLELQESGLRFTPTLTVKTPRGRHLYYRWQPGMRNRTGLRPGIDVRAEGGYVVAPPSGPTPDGLSYSWENDLPIATMPEWLALEVLPPAAPPPRHDSTDTVSAAYVQAALTRECQAVETAPEGQRNDTLNRSAFNLGQFVADGVLSAAVLEDELMLSAIGAGLLEREARRTIQSGMSAGLQHPRGVKLALSGSIVFGDRKDSGQEFKRTELGLADRFVAACGANVRYVAEWRNWVVWDGHRWAEDKFNQTYEMMKAVMRELYTQLEGMDEKQAKDLLRHLKECERHRTLTNALAAASSRREVVASQSEFDTDPWLLNCRNCIVDLRTGDVFANDKAHMMTKQAGADFIPGATHQDWGHFLETSVPDPATRQYLQVSAGYSATADTRLELLYLIHGPGASGKSTFIEAVSKALGDYSCAANFETFMKKRDGGATNDIARLTGKRFVRSSEVEEGRSLAMAVVKSLTGNDTITARKLYQENFEFHPTMKLWLVANARPKVAADDDALWRRVRVIPFDQPIPEERRDASLKHRLCFDPDRSSAVLAWIVAGAHMWHCTGYQEPPKPAQMTRATSEYRDENNEVKSWKTERLVYVEGSRVKKAQFYTDYRAWCERMGTRPVTDRKFSRLLNLEGVSLDENSHFRLDWALKTDF